MFCLQTLREENAGLRDEVRELTGKLEEQRRAAKRKVAELENLLRHVTEELSRAGDPARGASDGGQLAEDNARLEEELNRAEARQEQMAAEYEERLRIAEAAAPSSDELARLRKEKAAIEIVMNQLGEELEDEKHARQQAEQKAASAGTGVPVGASAAYDAAAAAMMADGSAGGEPRSQEALFRELDRAKAEHRTLQRESENRISELEQDLRAAQYDKQQAEDGAERQARDAEEMAKTKAHEYTGHLKELQQELVHVCNVLAVMEQNCKVLEKTQVTTTSQQPTTLNPPGSLGGGPSDLWRGVAGQENTGILEGAKQEIDELTHRIETLEAELAQSHVDKDALTAQLRTESEKRQQFEEYIINSEKKKSEVRAPSPRLWHCLVVVPPVPFLLLELLAHVFLVLLLVLVLVLSDVGRRVFWLQLAAHLGSSMHNIRTFSVAPQQAAAPVGAPQPGQYVSMQGAPNGYGQPPPPATYAPQGNGAMGIEVREPPSVSPRPVHLLPRD